MNDQEKYLAYAAIDDVCKDSCARKIVKWVMECELNGWDSIRPSNKWLANKFGWSEKALREKIWHAKKSQFITTTGRNKSRTFELNIQFLKGEMAKVLARKPMKRNIDFSDIMALENGGKVNNLVNTPVNNLVNNLVNIQQEANSNSNSNITLPTSNEETSPSAPQHEKTNVNLSTSRHSSSSPPVPLTPSPSEPTKEQKTREFVSKNINLFQDKFKKIDVPFEWEHCQDWYASKGKRVVDWAATFRNWLRSDIKKKERSMFERGTIFAGLKTPENSPELFRD